MNPGYVDAVIVRRREHAENALDAGEGFGALAECWNVSKVAARQWCRRHMAADDCAKLAENGRLRAHRAAADVGDRLALIDLCRKSGWTDARITRAIGMTRAGLCEWLKRNAPDGVQDALEDYREEQAA